MIWIKTDCERSLDQKIEMKTARRWVNCWPRWKWRSVGPFCQKRFSCKTFGFYQWNLDLKTILGIYCISRNDAGRLFGQEHLDQSCARRLRKPSMHWPFLTPGIGFPSMQSLKGLVPPAATKSTNWCWLFGAFNPPRILTGYCSSLRITELFLWKKSVLQVKSNICRCYDVFDVEQYIPTPTGRFQKLFASFCCPGASWVSWPWWAQKSWFNVRTCPSERGCLGRHQLFDNWPFPVEWTQTWDWTGIYHEKWDLKASFPIATPTTSILKIPTVMKISPILFQVEPGSECPRKLSGFWKFKKFQVLRLNSLLPQLLNPPKRDIAKSVASVSQLNLKSPSPIDWTWVSKRVSWIFWGSAQSIRASKTCLMIKQWLKTNSKRTQTRKEQAKERKNKRKKDRKKKDRKKERKKERKKKRKKEKIKEKKRKKKERN